MNLHELVRVFLPEGGPRMGLEGPAKPVRVEPLTLPAPARESEPAVAPEPVKEPTKEPVPA